MFKEVFYKINEKFNTNVNSTINPIHSNIQSTTSTETKRAQQVLKAQRRERRSTYFIIGTYSGFIQLLSQLRQFCSNHLTNIFYHHRVALQITCSIQTQPLDFGPESVTTS
jgi:hypothetical protein